MHVSTSAEEVEQTASYPQLVQTGNASGSHTSTLSSTLVKLRNLEDIYARCYMSIVELETYTEAARDEA